MHSEEILGVTDFKDAYQAVFKRKDLPNRFLYQEITFQVSNCLMNGNHASIVFVAFKFERLKLRLDNLKLFSPILALGVASVNETAFHPIRPFHIRAHQGENFFDLALVERFV